MFDGSNDITSVTFDCDLELLPCSTFRSCRNLTTVIFNGVIQRVAGIFDNPDAEEMDPDMQDSGYVQTNNYGAFMDCGKLSSIKFNEGLKYIGSAAFGRCPSISSISLPSTVEVIKDDAFAMTQAYGVVKSITMEGDSNQWFKVDRNSCLIRKGTADEGDTVILYANGSDITEYEIPTGVKTIISDAFLRCENLVSLTIPSGVEVIPSNCFMYCTKLTTVILPDTLTEIKSNYDGRFGGINYGKDQVVGSFSACEALTTINFSNTNIAKIGAEAFSGCALTSVTIPASVTEIGSLAFESCPIESFVVDVNNTHYASVDKVLYNKDLTVLIAYPICDLNTTTFTIPTNVITIEEKAFFNHKLTHIEVASTVTQINDNAFSSSTFDEETYSKIWHKFTIEFTSDVPPQLSGSNPLSAEVTIVVPDGTYKAYYMAFLGIGYEYMIDDTNAKKVTYIFNAQGGTEVANIEAVCVSTMPTTSKDGVFFQGWFTAAEDGEEVMFPYFYEGEGSSVTLYAIWGDTAREDGSCKEFAYVLTKEKRTLTLDNGTYYFVFKAEDFGMYDIEATITLFDYVDGFSASTELGSVEWPYFFVPGMPDVFPDTVFFAVTLKGLEEPQEFDIGMIVL